MRKVSILFVLIVLFFPLSAYANAPAPSPYDTDIAVDDYSKISQLEIVLSENGVCFDDIRQLQYPQETRRKDERIFNYHNDDGIYKSFKLKVTLISGEEQISNAVDFVGWSDYVYDVDKNILAQGKITSWKLSGFGLMFISFSLIAPLIITLLTEWLITLAFRLKPAKYVVGINLITNPIMNILLIVIFNNFMLDYYLILIILEILAAMLEFWFYTRKYKEHSKKRLALFTVTANIASWGVYYLISSGWFY